MRVLAIAALGFSLGTAGALYFPAGPGLRLVCGVLALLGLVALLLRRRALMARLCCLLLSAAAALAYVSVYDAVFTPPLSPESLSQDSYCGEVCAYSTRTSGGYGSVEVCLKLDGHEVRALLYYDGDEVFSPGDRLGFCAQLEDVAGDSYYAALGIRCTGFVTAFASLEQAARPPLRDWPAALANKLHLLVLELYPEDVSGFLSGLLIGTRDGLDEVFTSELIRSGIYHTVSVSGMHVAILIGLLQFLTRRRRRLTMLLGIPAVLFFVLLTGASAGAVRAGVMVLLVLVAPLFRRQSDSLTSLGFALLVMLLYNPHQLASVSFQLTFLATAGILLLASPILRMLVPEKRGAHPRLARLWRAAASVLSVTLAAQLATMPVTAWYFGQVSLVAPLTNLLTSLAISLAFSLGALSLPLGAVFAPLALPLIWPTVRLLRYVRAVSALLAKLPFAALYTISPYVLIFLLFVYCALLVLLLSRERRPLVPACCTVIVLCVCLLLSTFGYDSASFTLTVLDVGQGQCLLLSSGGATVMYDCGGSNAQDAGELAGACLDAMAETKLDVLVLSHYDEDHMGGVRYLMARKSVGLVLAPDFEDDSGNRAEIEELCEAYEIPLLFVTHLPEQITLGEGSVTVIPPVAYGSGNESSLSLFASFDGYDILATGDMSESGERLLLRKYRLPDLEVLIAGHHGASTSTSEELLAELTPELVVISVGENSYGHPTEQTLERIAQAGAAVRRTDQEGTITIRR